MNLVEECFEMVQYVGKGNKRQIPPPTHNNNAVERAARPLTPNATSCFNFGRDEGTEMFVRLPQHNQYG